MSAWLNPKHLLTMDVHAGKLLSNLCYMEKLQRLSREGVHYKRLVVEVVCPCFLQGEEIVYSHVKA